MDRPYLIFDSETLPDYYLASFMEVETGKIHDHELYDGKVLQPTRIRALLERFTLVTFNGINFDLPVLGVALDGGGPLKVKNAANKLIDSGQRYWQLNLDPPEHDQIDLIEVAPGQASLKLYGGRLGSPKLQDMPIHHNAKVSPAMRGVVREYCHNDLRETLDLFHFLKPQIDLRIQMSQQYGIDLRSKSDAQIAEAIIRHEVEQRSGQRVPRADPLALVGQKFRYTAPAWVKFRDPGLRETLETIHGTDFEISEKGGVKMPAALAKLKVTVAGRQYKMGMGGLHSCEKEQAVLGTATVTLYDHDVTSYYPSLIINCDLAPPALGKHFMPVYRSIVERRVIAKKKGDKVTADVLKIVANGTFGKLGSPYSCLYAPNQLIQVTLTGQLALLMLIELFERNGIPVVSANTDGVVVQCRNDLSGTMRGLMGAWEKITGLALESAKYNALYSRDVNSYIAIKDDGKAKLKGYFAENSLSKNPHFTVIRDAVVKQVTEGVPVADTINACEDMTKFVAVRKVKGGGEFLGKQLGRVVRWYVSTLSESAIHYVSNGNKVPLTDHAIPMMGPMIYGPDVDKAWYIEQAREALADIGVLKRERKSRGKKAAYIGSDEEDLSS